MKQTSAKTTGAPPVVSVVTPSYNQGRFIEETIKSVLSQEGDFLLEYVIMDGGSKDDSVEIIRKYERLLKEGGFPIKCLGVEFAWRSEKDRGQADAVNKGFRAARGEVIGWLNSDDTYLPGAIGKAVSFFRQNPDTMMVYGEAYYTDEDGRVTGRYPTEDFDADRIQETCFICQPAVFLRRKVIDEAGGVDPLLHFCMDYEFWIRITRKMKAARIPEFVATSRLHAETKTVSRRLEAASEAVRMLKRHYGEVKSPWIFSYAYMYAERFVGTGTLFKRYIFKALSAIVYFYKFASVNRAFPKVPAPYVKRFFRGGL